MLTQESTAGVVCFKMPSSLKEKLISFVFYSHMGRKFLRPWMGSNTISEEVWCPAFKIKFSLYLVILTLRLILLQRVDPTCVTEEKVETPLEIAEERRHTDIVALLLEAAGEELPDNLKIQRLSEAMYKEDVGEAKKEFNELLGSLSPELVS